MSKRVKEGVQLRRIDPKYGPSYVVGDNCESITIREQAGHMAMIPAWVEVAFNNGRSVMLNLYFITAFEWFDSDAA